MKISKKVVVSSLSTAAALSFVAALSGTLAWFQYNTRVSTTMIGTGVAETGALQIKTATGDWKRDLITSDLVEDRIELKPVTFGEIDKNDALPAKAYMKPDASENWKENDSDYTVNDHTPGSYADVYKEAEANKDYIQYSVYIRAMGVDNVSGGEKKVAKDVYLSSIVFANITEGAKIAEGLRAHIAIDNDGDGSDDTYFLLSKDGVKNLKMSGALDLDGDGIADREQGPEWNATREKMVTYGNDGEFQNAYAADELKVTRDANNSIDGNDPENMKKKLFTTLEGAKDVKVTVTLWLEGWDTSVGEKEIDASELLYQEATYLKPVSVVEDYFQKDGDNYVKEAASAKAVDGKTYFEMIETEITTPVNEDFEDGVVPYEKDGDNYVKSADDYVKPAKTYYTLIAKSVDDLVYPADLTAELAKTYVEDADHNMVKCTETAAACDLSKPHYLLANTGDFYQEKVLEDREHNPLPSDSVSVEGLFIKDGDNFIKAHDMNDASETYYEFKNGGKIGHVPMWSGEKNDGAEFRFGLTFDVGADAFEK